MRYGHGRNDLITQELETAGASQTVEGQINAIIPGARLGRGSGVSQGKIYNGKLAPWLS